LDTFKKALFTVDLLARSTAKTIPFEMLGYSREEKSLGPPWSVMSPRLLVRETWMCVGGGEEDCLRKSVSKGDAGTEEEGDADAMGEGDEGANEVRRGSSCIEVVCEVDIGPRRDGTSVRVS
jgi:hypothetical protein